MRKYFLLMLALMLSASSLLAQQRTISVSGSSTIAVKPDHASFTVKVDKMIPLAQKWTDPGPDTFIDSLVAAGVSVQDIEVLERMPADQVALSNYEMFHAPPPPPPAPFEEYEEEPAPKKKGKKTIQNDTYEALDMSPPPPTTKLMRTTYRVKIRNMQILPEALNVAQGAANYMPEARYDVSDRNPLKIKALQEAMENARAKALVLAEKMGGTLGEIISIDDSESGSFVSTMLDLARMYTSGNLDGGLLNMPEIGNVKVTYSVK